MKVVCVDDVWQAMDPTLPKLDSSNPVKDGIYMIRSILPDRQYNILWLSLCGFEEEYEAIAFRPLVSDHTAEFRALVAPIFAGRQLVSPEVKELIRAARGPELFAQLQETLRSSEHDEG